MSFPNAFIGNPGKSLYYYTSKSGFFCEDFLYVFLSEAKNLYNFNSRDSSVILINQDSLKMTLISFLVAALQHCVPLLPLWLYFLTAEFTEKHRDGIKMEAYYEHDIFHMRML